MLKSKAPSSMSKKSNEKIKVKNFELKSFLGDGLLLPTTNISLNTRTRNKKNSVPISTGLSKKRQAHCVLSILHQDKNSENIEYHHDEQIQEQPQNEEGVTEKTVKIETPIQDINVNKMLNDEESVTNVATSLFEESLTNTLSEKKKPIKRRNVNTNKKTKTTEIKTNDANGNDSVLSMYSNTKTRKKNDPSVLNNEKKTEIKQKTIVKSKKKTELKKGKVDKKALIWHCNTCEKRHGFIGKSAISSFCLKCGWNSSSTIKTDGDCFFNSVDRCLSNGLNEVQLSVQRQREAVSSKMTEDLLESYLMLAQANPEDDYLNFLRPQPIIIEKEETPATTQPSEPIGSTNRIGIGIRQSKRLKTCLSEDKLASTDSDIEFAKKKIKKKKGSIEKEGTSIEEEAKEEKEVEYADAMVGNLSQFQAYVLREGVTYGADGCIWADEFAQKVIAELANLAIVFIDMERSIGSTPYRLLACSQHPTHLIILKRKGPVGHFSYIRQTNGTSCFLIEKLPDMVKVLWKENITQVAETQEHVARLRDRIYTEVDNKIDNVDNKVDNVNTKVDNVDTKVDKVDTKIDTKVDKVDTKIDIKVDKVDTKVDKVDTKVQAKAAQKKRKTKIK